jgi:hypothetical protein
MKDWVFERQLRVRHTVQHRLRLLRPASFTLDGTEYRYAAHRYNTTWLNERAVEVALADALLEENAGRRTFELGNVMSHYGRTGHDVVDKYEVAPGVRNTDIVDIEAEPYDIVISLSTVEHVGQDEEPREPEKALRALERLVELTAPAGDLLVTFPVGHNPALDVAVADERLPFAAVSYLRRLDAANTWRQAGKDDVVGLAYGTPYAQANGLVVCRGRGD